MRTTLTLEPDVAAELERLRLERKTSFKDLVNDTLRRGLRDIAASKTKRKPFRTRSFHGGRLLVDSIDNVWEVLDQVDGAKLR